MGSKNNLGNGALVVRPSATYIYNKKTIRPFNAATTRPNYEPKPVIDLKTLTQHPSITIISNKEISIYVEMCGSMPEEATNMSALRAVLPEYNSIKKLSIKIHAPWPHTESKEYYNSRVISLKKLSDIINEFKLYTIKVTMSIDKCNFPQMKLGAFVHSLRFKKWQLYYQVYDEVKEVEEDATQIFRGSEYDLRLRGVYKKEFLSLK